jgi:hypothetical protein
MRKGRELQAQQTATATAERGVETEHMNNAKRNTNKP